MSGFWYTTAIAATTGAFLSFINGPQQPISQSVLPSANERVASQSVSPRGTSLPSAAKTLTITPLKGIVSGTDASDPTAAGKTAAGKTASGNTSAAKADTNTTAFTNKHYVRAMELANQAVLAYQAAQQMSAPDDKLALTQRERFLWQATLQKLASVPASDESYDQAQLKYAQYEGLLATAQGKLADGDNAFLRSIIQDAGVALDQAHVTLCQVGAPIDTHAKACRHHQGEQLMASPASLIKLPIAIALMDKTNHAGTSLSQKIYIDPDNFTENAEGASIDIDQEYTLSQVMTRMINESNNIATNQLIDYVGRDSIAQTLADRGYDNTLVDHKLAGDRILPPNPGTQSNQSTTDDLTAMMAQIYGLENPGDEALLTALLSQRDQELGHQALQDMSPAIQWLGEKTGQNDRLIGSTLAMKVGEHRYALTVAIDYSADPEAVRAIVSGVARHLLDQGSLIPAN